MDQASSPEEADTDSEQKPAAANPDRTELNEEEQQQVIELEQRDREVRAHEAAHLAAAGSYATGGADFSYQRGPNGQQYAIGGEVSIDTSTIAGDPQATLQKALQIQRAALAPAEPSGQDRRVASEAASMAARARQEISSQTSATAQAGAPTSRASQGEQASEGEQARQQDDPAQQLMERIRARGAMGSAIGGSNTASLHLVA
jgi:hypothetical protein